jgi:hypothetical protein
MAREMARRRRLEYAPPMSENVFLLGLFGSMAIMFVVMDVWATRQPAPSTGPIRLTLGPALSPRALGATLAAFVVGFGLLGGLAVAAHHQVGKDGPLYVAFLLPWSIPGLFWAARWGLDTGAPGQLVLDDAIQHPLRGGLGARWFTELMVHGPETATQAPRGSMSLVADLGQARELRARLRAAAGMAPDPAPLAGGPPE